MIIPNLISGNFVMMIDTLSARLRHRLLAAENPP